MQHDPGSSRLAQLEADNQRLRRLLDQKHAPAELRHRLRTTLALLRNVIKQSAQSRIDVSTYVAHLEDRLDSLVRVQGYIDTDGEVDLATLILDELFSYAVHEGGQLDLAGPDVRLQPRAGQSLGLAIHELAVNAIEHGGLLTGAGRIHVGWRVEHGDPDARLTLEWKERGSSQGGEPSHRGFGTEVLTAMLPHELNAKPKLAYEPDGVRFTLTLPLTPRTGRLVAERSTPQK